MYITCPINIKYDSIDLYKEDVASVIPQLPDSLDRLPLVDSSPVSINDITLFFFWLKEMTLYMCAAFSLLLPVLGDSSDECDKDSAMKTSYKC